jgi:hypothetical protein
MKLEGRVAGGLLALPLDPLMLSALAATRARCARFLSSVLWIFTVSRFRAPSRVEVDRVGG